jgi:[acyl-carrier-protein] S-malonyltransferase
MKKVAYIFPGQGSQAIGMGESFYNNCDVVKEIIGDASDRLSIDFTKLLFEGKSGDATLEQTQYTQPAILLVSAIANELLTSRYAIKPEFVMGHSLGEFSSLVSVGALNITDAIELVHKRGLFMKEACENLGDEAGMMVVLGLSDEKLEEITRDLQNDGKKIWCANYNNDSQVVLAGIKSHLDESINIIKEKGAKRAMLLNMSVASHCPLLEEASVRLKDVLQNSIKDTFTAPVISNVTSKAYSSKEEAIPLLLEQLIKPVLYKQSIIAHSDKCDLFIEFGHAKVLQGLNKKITQTPTISINEFEALDNASEFLI